MRLTIADTGEGMPADVVAHAFDPFFTTKPEGEGTGLGLSVVYGIVERAGGRIEIDSTPGAGTRFTIDAPGGAGRRARRAGARRARPAACAA